jgi:hypothetical protein
MITGEPDTYGSPAIFNETVTPDSVIVYLPAVDLFFVRNDAPNTEDHDHTDEISGDKYHALPSLLIVFGRHFIDADPDQVQNKRHHKSLYNA